jgi:limonene-1,2-epoxide hydrolase
VTIHDPVREFIRAFNGRDLDAFVAVLHPEVDKHSMRGVRRSVEAARLWATRPPGGAQQTIELEALHEDEVGGDGTAVAWICRRWHWEEDGSEAGVDEMAWLFELRGNRVLSWRPFEDRAEAMRAAGFDPHGAS